ncbi:hypothetical protein KL86APRO_30077 [uncultured Alphaproteobacteria bacterium]|uniref:Uncharacterized protein n=1 Tax=uncultured Alphaproteobacteria bacterium TaxID=91750 RepID=A0A212KLI0_9PROT|nr:hypothetical protein KL86APRO_30077 [uncultured Alphaproteobacteria bacterium]
MNTVDHTVNLILSDGIKPEHRDQIYAGITPYLEIPTPRIHVRKADHSTLHEAILLIGDALGWIPLKAAATVYLGTLAKHAGDATWDHIKSLCSRNKSKKFADFPLPYQKILKKLGLKQSLLPSIFLTDFSE